MHTGDLFDENIGMPRIEIFLFGASEIFIDDVRMKIDRRNSTIPVEQSIHNFENGVGVFRTHADLWPEAMS